MVIHNSMSSSLRWLESPILDSLKELTVFNLWYIMSPIVVLDK